MNCIICKKLIESGFCKNYTHTFYYGSDIDFFVLIRINRTEYMIDRSGRQINLFVNGEVVPNFDCLNENTNYEKSAAILKRYAKLGSFA